MKIDTEHYGGYLDLSDFEKDLVIRRSQETKCNVMTTFIS